MKKQEAEYEENVSVSKVTKIKNPLRVAAGRKSAEVRKKKLQELMQYKNTIKTAQESGEHVDNENKFNDIEPKIDIDLKQQEKSWLNWFNPYIIVPCVGGVCIIIAFCGYNTKFVGRSNTAIQENTKKERDPFQMD